MEGLLSGKNKETASGITSSFLKRNARLVLDLLKCAHIVPIFPPNIFLPLFFLLFKFWRMRKLGATSNFILQIQYPQTDQSKGQ